VAAEEATENVSSVQTGNVHHAGRLESFYQIEEGGWRGAAKRFAREAGLAEARCF
jgi:hypothetical protein